MNGRVQALLRLGAGYHPEFSGRENVRSSLTHLGLADEALEAAIEEVIDFVELGAYLDQPLRTYSLGMMTRLMFATATAIRPEVLLIDELLGSGDPYFTVKCAHRVEQIVDSGCTLLLVSHNTQQTLQFCDRIVWLDGGRVVRDGDALDVIGDYEAFLEMSSERIFAPSVTTEPSSAAAGAPHEREDEHDYSVKLADGRVVHRWPGKPGVKITRLSVLDCGAGEAAVGVGEPTHLEFDLVAELAGEYVLRYLVTFWRGDGRRIARVENVSDRFALAVGGVRTIRVDLGPMRLGPGEYVLSFSVYDISVGTTEPGRTVRYDVLHRAIRLSVVPPAPGIAPAIALPVEWSTGRPSVVR